jgi:prepilin-type N-terminal cleavage/methylation domain-containing protein
MSARAPRQNRTRAGFTLVEVMVALLAGSFVIMAAFYMSDVSSRLFSEQMRRSEAQMNVRAATELLRRDIGRAGFLSVRDSGELLDAVGVLGATGPAGTDVAPQLVTAASVQLDARGRQMLILTGNMSTSEQYFVSSSNGMNLLLQTTNDSFRRSFVDQGTGIFLPNRFLEAFFPLPAAPGPGRMVSVTELSIGKIYLRNIDRVVMGTTPPTLLLSTPLPGMNAMGSGPFMNVQSIAVAPVSTIRYAMEIPDASLARVGGRTYLTGGNIAGGLHPVLVRRELDSSNLTPIAGTERVVLDSVVDQAEGFKIEAVVNRLAPLGMDLVHQPLPQNLVPAAQGTIHSLIIQLVLETEQQQGDVVSQTNARAARRAIRFEVMLPNAARNSGALN